MAIDIAALDVAINTLVTNPMQNYSVGDKSFSSGDLIRQLMELRRNLAEVPDVALELLTFDSQGIELSGHDSGQTSIPL